MRLFIKEDVFKELCRSIGYSDVNTIYGDLSRLVVAFLETNTNQQKKLNEIYNSKYRRNANIKAIIETFKKWREE